MVTFSPDDITREFSFHVFKEGLYEAIEVVSLFLVPEGGEAAVVVSPERGQVFIEDSDSKRHVLGLYTICFVGGWAGSPGIPPAL